MGRENRKDKAATMDRLTRAVGSVLARQGPGGVGVNAVAREAGVDKVLIYRYFGGLHELVSAYALSGDFWPPVDELLDAGGDQDAGQCGDEDAPACLLARWLRGFARALRRRPQTLEVMAWELVERNELTDILDDRRQRTARELLGRLGPRVPGAVRLDTALALLTAAVTHLALASRRRGSVAGLDLTAEAGWDQIMDTVELVLLKICN